MSDTDSDFTEEEMRNMAAGHALLEAQRSVRNGEDEPDGGKWHYERVPIKGAVPLGAFRLPNHAIHKLGSGDPRASGAVIKHLFDVDPENPAIVPAATVRKIGNGDVKAGHWVLRRFVSMLGRTSRAKAMSHDR